MINSQFIPCSNSKSELNTILLLIHPAFNSSIYFEPYLKELNLYFDILLIDLPNHGKSGFYNNVNYSIIAQLIFKQIMSRFINNGKKIIGLGVSDGANVLLHLGLEYNCFSKMILLAACYNVQGINIYAINKLKNTEYTKISNYAKFSIVNESRFNETKKLLLENPKLTKQELKKILTKTTIVSGDKDPIIKLSHTVSLYRAIENAELIILPNTQHDILTKHFRFILNYVINSG